MATSRTYRQGKELKDSKSKNKKQIIFNSQTNNQNEYDNSRRVIIDDYENANNNKSLNYVLKSGNIQHSSTNYRLRQENNKVISMKKEEYYTKDNKNNMNKIK